MDEVQIRKNFAPPKRVTSVDLLEVTSGEGLKNAMLLTLGTNFEMILPDPMPLMIFHYFSHRFSDSKNLQIVQERERGVSLVCVPGVPEMLHVSARVNIELFQYHISDVTFKLNIPAKKMH